MNKEAQLDPWYITGFCEGEASFTYSKSGSGLNLYFSVKLTKADSTLLNNIYDFFGVGKIYNIKKAKPSLKSGYTKSAVYYRVTNVEDLWCIVAHFDKYSLVGEKKKRYEIWREMFFLKRNFRSRRNEELLRLARELSSTNPKNIPWE